MMGCLGERIKKLGNTYDFMLWKINRDKSIEILIVNVIVMGDVWKVVFFEKIVIWRLLNIFSVIFDNYIDIYVFGYNYKIWRKVWKVIYWVVSIDYLGG